MTRSQSPPAARSPWLRWPSTVAAVVLVAVACGSACFAGSAGKFKGTWACSAGGGDFLSVVSDGGLKVTDETGTTRPAELVGEKLAVALDSEGGLSANLTIDSSSGELVCPTCGCKRFSPVVDASKYEKTVVRWRCAASEQTHGTSRSDCEELELAMLRGGAGSDDWCLRKSDIARCTDAMEAKSLLELAQAGGPAPDYPDGAGRSCSPRALATRCGGMDKP